MKSQTMNIVIAINRTYIPYAYVLLTSLFLNNPYPINIYVLHHDLLPEDEQTLNQLSKSYSTVFHYLFVPDSLLPPQDVLSSTPWGIETYFRLVILDLLPANIDRALYLDSDMIVNRSLDELYFCDFKGKKLAACYDFQSTPPFNDYRDVLFSEILSKDFHYFNAGLILFNLNELRSNYSFKTYMNTSRKLANQIQFPDQDLLNYCHHDEILLLDPKHYNLFARRAYTDYHLRYDDVKANVSVIHYTNSKPWQGNCLHCDIEQLWWDYAALTPFYHELMEHMVHEIMFDTTIRTYSSNIQLEHQQLLDIINKYKQILTSYHIPLEF